MTTAREIRLRPGRAPQVGSQEVEHFIEIIVAHQRLDRNLGSRVVHILSILPLLRRRLLYGPISCHGV